LPLEEKEEERERDQNDEAGTQEIREEFIEEGTGKPSSENVESHEIAEEFRINFPIPVLDLNYNEEEDEDYTPGFNFDQGQLEQDENDSIAYRTRKRFSLDRENQSEILFLPNAFYQFGTMSLN